MHHISIFTLHSENDTYSFSFTTGCSESPHIHDVDHQQSIYIYTYRYMKLRILWNNESHVNMVMVCVWVIFKSIIGWMAMKYASLIATGHQRVINIIHGTRHEGHSWGSCTMASWDRHKVLMTHLCRLFIILAMCDIIQLSRQQWLYHNIPYHVLPYAIKWNFH